MATVSEHLLTVDSYNKPMVIEDKDAIAILFLRLLVMVPGTNRMHPEMGINVRGRYEYCHEGDEDDLKTEIIDQINTYLPDYSDSEVNCDVKEGNIFISITVDDTVFNYSTAGNSVNDSDDEDDGDSVISLLDE